MTTDAPSSGLHPPDHGVIASATPHRTRVRIRPSIHAAATMARAEERLRKQPGVESVEATSRTGSLVVTHHSGEHTLDGVIATLRDVGVIVHDVFKAVGEEVPDVGPSKTAMTVAGALDDLDRRISKATGHRVDLKLLFPLSLGALGIRQLLVEGIGLAEVPAYVLLWYAFDSFYKLHQQVPPPGEAATEAAADAVHARDAR